MQAAMGRLVGGRQARLRLGSHRAMCFLDQKCRIMSFNGALSASAKHVMSTSGSEGRPEGSTVGDAGVGVSTMSPLVAGLEAEVQRLLDGESSFNVLNDLCARQDPPVAPISDHYSFNNGDVGAVHQALQIGGALSAQVEHVQDVNLPPLDEQGIESQLPTVETFLEQMATHPQGLYDVRKLENEELTLWPSAVRTYSGSCDQVLRLNFNVAQLLLWALAPPQGLDTGRLAKKTPALTTDLEKSQHAGNAGGKRRSGIERRLEHVWKKRGQQSLLKLPYGDYGTSVVGQQSHGTTMVLDALEEICCSPRGQSNDESTNSCDHLAAVLPSHKSKVAVSSLLLNSLLTSGPVLDRRVGLGRAACVIQPFLVAWTQRNIIVDQIDQTALRILLSNFEALAANTRIRSELLAEAPSLDLCLEGRIPFDAVRAYAAQWDNHVREYLRILAQATIAVSTLMHMQIPEQAVSLLSVSRAWLVEDSAFSTAEQMGIDKLFDDTLSKLQGLD